MTSNLTIRAATPADLAGVDALLGRAYPALLKGAYPPSLLVTAIPLLSKAQPRLLATGTYFVVTDGDEIIGAGGWTRAQPGNWDKGQEGIGNIRHVVTDHRRTRQGIGRMLMNHVFATSEAAGVTRLECYSTLMAVPFYAACGFAEIGAMTVPLRPGIDFPAVHMRRESARSSARA
jgi:predicted N-acetyltransferase YhbS